MRGPFREVNWASQWFRHGVGEVTVWVKDLLKDLALHPQTDVRWSLFYCHSYPPSPHLCLCCLQNGADVHLANGCALSFAISPHCKCALARIGLQHFLKEVEEVTIPLWRRCCVVCAHSWDTFLPRDALDQKQLICRLIYCFVCCVFVAVHLCHVVWHCCCLRWMSHNRTMTVWILSFCMMSFVFLLM